MTLYIFMAVLFVCFIVIMLLLWRKVLGPRIQIRKIHVVARREFARRQRPIDEKNLFDERVAEALQNWLILSVRSKNGNKLSDSDRELLWHDFVAANTFAVMEGVKRKLAPSPERNPITKAPFEDTAVISWV